MTAVLEDDTELFKQSMDNESFRRNRTGQANAPNTPANQPVMGGVP